MLDKAKINAEHLTDIFSILLYNFILVFGNLSGIVNFGQPGDQLDVGSKYQLDDLLGTLWTNYSIYRIFTKK